MALDALIRHGDTAIFIKSTSDMEPSDMKMTQTGVFLKIDM